MKKYNLINVSLLILLLYFFVYGCTRPLIPKYFQEAQEAIDIAYCSEAHKKCPKEYHEVIAMWEEAQRLYRAGRYEEGIALARKVKDTASILCPPIEEKVAVVAPPKPKETKPPKKTEEKIVPVDILDSDGDGVPDIKDLCADTPRGVKVDERGCPLDSDMDGVPDYKDRCADTPRGVKVDERGCPLDSDMDGVPDYLDKCPGTPRCATVNKEGCWIIKNVHFDFDKWDIKPQYYRNLDEVVNCIKEHPNIKIEIHGHTDNIGTEGYNQKLSERRANEVMQYFVKKGITKDRLTTQGFSFLSPIDTNKTSKGRAMNRRVELKRVY